MVFNVHCLYYQNVLHDFTIKNRRYVFMLPPLPPMTTNFVLILDFREYIASTASCKFMSSTKMLYTLIRNSLTNTCLCTYMINKNKCHLMCFLFINSMFQLEKQAWD
jgi:hypothetical protein